MTALPETFRCAALSCTLTRHGCGERHVRAKNNGRTPGARVNDRAIFAAACRDCAIGAAHARGERPDVTIASIVARVTETKNEEVVMAGAKRHEHDGENLTIREWKERFTVADGLTDAAIGMRLTAGWSVPDAFNTPKGKPRPGPAEKPTMEAKRGMRSRAKETLDATVEATRGKRGPLPLPAPHVTPEARALGLRSLGDEVRETMQALSPAELLTRVGYDAEDAGLVPAGRLILVRTSSASQVCS